MSAKTLETILKLSGKVDPSLMKGIANGQQEYNEISTKHER